MLPTLFMLSVIKKATVQSLKRSRLSNFQGTKMKKNIVIKYLKYMHAIDTDRTFKTLNDIVMVTYNTNRSKVVALRFLSSD